MGRLPGAREIVFRLVALLALSLAMFTGLAAPPTSADGGPVVDPFLFPRLKEGQQVAVVTLNDLDSATVDLFVSILDETGESHEIVYFVPLGVEAESLTVREEDSFAFNNALVKQLDTAVYNSYNQDQGIVRALFAGALLTNGVWLTPLWLPFLLTSCGEASAPLATFRTDSSRVDVFSIDESTDLQSLIDTTGLHPSVTETLARLRGQQIAVVNLRTPLPGGASGSTGASQAEPGLHLSWRTALTATGSRTSCAYPLGTGAAWAQPIEMTRVYVVAPEHLAFSVQ